MTNNVLTLISLLITGALLWLRLKESYRKEVKIICLSPKANLKFKAIRIIKEIESLEQGARAPGDALGLLCVIKDKLRAALRNEDEKELKRIVKKVKSRKEIKDLIERNKIT